MQQILSDRVLFVDDDDAVRHTFERSMRKAGIPCDVAHNGAHAIELAREHAYCVVATDYSMPGQNGLELRDSLRELQPDATFVLISAQCTLELALQATNDHAFTYVLTKPWRSAELHSLMNRAAEEAWERSSARVLAQRSMQRSPSNAADTIDNDNTALLASVSSIVSQVCGTTSHESQRRTERFRALGRIVCDAMHVTSETRRDVDMASVVLAASLGADNEGPDPSGWLPSSGPFVGARTALEQVNERWDGRGEPEGRSGEHIDLRARILAAVRAFDFSLAVGDPEEQLEHVLYRTKEQLIARAGTELAPAVIRALIGVEERELRGLYRPLREAPVLIAI